MNPSSSSGNPPVQIINQAILDDYLLHEGSGQRQFPVHELTPFQTAGLLRPEFEIFCGGGKFGGKSFLARAFLLKGNPHLPDSASLINSSYIYHPNYRATILRRNQQDLDDFLRRFHSMATIYGGRYTRGLFEFPSGAVIACGHLADRDAWQKYIGVENVRFVIEEAALIPDFELFDQVRSCCRSIWPEMIPQILLTSNAGGPGTGWLIDRFYEAKSPDGDLIPPGETIHELVKLPDFDDPVDKTRVFLFSTYRDNPHARNDPGYIGTLATMKDPKMRAAYLDGDWKIFSGTYFNFSPDIHTIPSQPSLLKPWWHRWGSIDVGYTHRTAVFWGCRNPFTRQAHVYRELVVSETSFVQIGYEIASRSLAELEAHPSHAMTFYISPDAIRKVTEQKTISDLIMEGMARKLGQKAVHFPEEEVRKFRELQQSSFTSSHEEDQRWAKLLDKLKSQRRAGITLRMATNDRIPGWQFMRESMRTTPIGESLPPFDPLLYDQLYRDSPDRADQYLRLYQNNSPEVLPMLQIWQPSPDLGPYWGCPSLIRAIPKAHHEDKPGKNVEDVSASHWDGSDECDSARYLLMGLQDIPTQAPYEDFRDQQVEAYLHNNPNATTNDLVWVQRGLEAKWKETNGGNWKPFSMPRKSKVMRYGGPAAFAAHIAKLLPPGKTGI